MCGARSRTWTGTVAM